MDEAAPSPAPKHAGGRPVRLKPDEATLAIVKGLGQIQATYAECAAVLGVDKHTFVRFKDRHEIVEEMLERGKNSGLVSLRRAQFQKAVEEKNPTMLIWLGKQYLGQVDKYEHRMGETDSKPLKYQLTDDELLLIASGGAKPKAGGSGGAAPQSVPTVTD